MAGSDPGSDSARHLGQQGARAGALHQVRDFACAGSRTDADRDDAGLLTRQHHGVDAGTVGQLQGNAVAGRVRGRERRRDPRRPVVVLAPRHRLARRGFDERGSVGSFAGVARNQLRDCPG